MIKRLQYNEFKGKNYKVKIESNKYLKIEKKDFGFLFEWEPYHDEYYLEDEILSNWLDNPIAYGYYNDNELLGYVEGYLESWNNRFRLTNICVFETNNRSQGIGELLLDRIEADAKNMNARMIVLETQSYNHKAIEFYKKHNYDIIGFDLYAYSNNDPEAHNIRIEMGKNI